MEVFHRLRFIPARAGSKPKAEGLRVEALKGTGARVEVETCDGEKYVISFGFPTVTTIRGVKFGPNPVRVTIRGTGFVPYSSVMAPDQILATGSLEVSTKFGGEWVVTRLPFTRRVTVLASPATLKLAIFKAY